MPASTSGGRGASVGMRALADRDRLEQPRDDLIGVDAVGLRLEIEQDSVAQDRRRHRADVLRRRGAPPFEQRARLGPEHERLAGARTGAPFHPVTNRFGHAVRRPSRRPAGADDRERVVDHVRRRRNVADQMTHRFDVGGGGDRPDCRFLVARRRRQDAVLLRRRRVVDDDVEHEAIELRFRQRVGAFLLDRVLRGEDEQRTLQFITDAVHRHLVLLHRLQQRRLRLRRRPVDLVGEDHVREHRARDEADLAAAGRAVFFDHLGTDDVRRHQVGRELDAIEFEVDRLGERLDEQGFRKTGDAAKQAVAAGKEGGEDVLHDGVLSDDRAAELVAEARREALRLVQRHRRNCISATYLVRKPNWRSICDANRIVNLMRYDWRTVTAAVAAVGAMFATGCTKTETSITAPSGAADRCSLTVTTSPNSFPSPGGKGSLTISTARDCTWSVASNASWVALGGGGGQGEGTIPYTVAANPVPSPRSAAIAVGAQSVAVSQQAAPCVFSLSRANDTIGEIGGKLSVGVTTLSGCRWTAASGATWISVTAGQSGDANGTVGLTVAANAGPARVGQVNIAGQTYTVSQAATAPSPAPTPPSPAPGPPPPGPAPGPPPAPTPTPTPTPTPRHVEFSGTI